MGSCCGGKGGRSQCPRNAPTMCNQATCGAGRQEHCCQHQGHTYDDWGGERPCDAPENPPTCPWDEHSDEDNVLVCGDGTRCNVLSDPEGWGCCASRDQRLKCPQNMPDMCNTRECSGDYCCAQTNACEDLGLGRRPCSLNPNTEP